MEVIHRAVSVAILGEPIERAFPGNTRTLWDSRTLQRVEIDAAADDGVYQYLLELSHDVENETVTLRREQVTYDSRVLFQYDGGLVRLYDNEGRIGTEFPFRGARSFLPQLDPGAENPLLTWFLDFLEGVWLLKLDPTDINPESRVEAESLDPDGANFASWYRHLSQERPENLPQLFEKLRVVLPGFRALKAVSTGKGGQKRELVAVWDYGELNFDDLSDGERATIVLYCILMNAEAEPSTLLLDEPENFVGLQLIQPWLVQLADAARDGGQLFITSHHPEVVDYLSADRTLMFVRLAGGPTHVVTDPFDGGQGLKASELVARGLLDAK